MVLLVDDDADVRDALGDLIKLRGYRVAFAENGQEALDFVLDGNEPCVILLDLVMPVMDGWALLSRLQTSVALRRIPVVVISAHATAVPPTGVQRVLLKPVDPSDLYSAVEEHCPPPS
jgi:CheY-like chemotaxis protein